MRTSPNCWAAVPAPSARCATAGCGRYANGSWPTARPTRLRWRFPVARIEDLLRDEFGRTDLPAGPGRDEMLGRVTRVRRLRMAGVATGGLAAVTAVALAAVSLVQPHLRGNGFGDGGPARQFSIEAINTVFTDRQHG